VDTSDTSRAPTKRFEVNTRTLAVDRWMSRLIHVGGISVIAAVLGMLVFLVAEVVPLFAGARVTELPPVPLAAPAGSLVGADEYGELPHVCLPDGTLRFHRPDGKLEREWKPDLGGRKVSSVRRDDRGGLLLLGLSDGSVAEVRLGYRARFDEAGVRTVEADPSLVGIQAVGAAVPVESAWVARGQGSRLYIVRQKVGGESRLTGLRVTERKALGGKVRSTPGEPFAVAADFADIESELVPSTGDMVLAIRRGGEVAVIADAGEGFRQIQSFRPVGESRRVTSAGLVLGDVTAVFGSDDGSEHVWSLHPQRQADGKLLRRWGEVRASELFSGAMLGFAPALGNKCYLAVAADGMQIRHLTTGSVRWEGQGVAGFRSAFFSRNHDLLGVVDARGDLRRWSIMDHHPEAGWRAFFGKVWYEGGMGPEYAWQSSSGSDDFEPKYSLMPLVYGTFKGTLFAMAFALPVALLSAVYVSQFLRPSVKKFIKPTMEVMASLPSVVLGFVGGLWLAPLVDAHLVALLAMALTLPAAGLLFGAIWSAMPLSVRRRVPPGREFLALVPVLLLAAWAVWLAAPGIEAALFTVADPGSGQPVADFREWWRQATGLGYDARNAVVVGFVMGFAVIPVIFTIAEDALSNVPPALVSGSLALGASRWQTVWRVIMPTALAGIFSAVMIGFGRAVGETMIVVMATGNTPVMELNAFSGMRTLSANIAVELPEAPVGHTHYRALFLGACCLFLLTFALNTAAEVLRQRLRERYKVI